MTTRKKPGRDTLTFFWSGVAVYLLGLLVPQIAILPALRLDFQVAQTLQVVSLLCFIVAGVLGVIVMHKVISMVVYLVHHKR